MFHKIFSTKFVNFFKKRSNSTKDVSLNGKIVIGHNTIILIISIEGFKGTTKRLYFDKETLEQICLDFLNGKCETEYFLKSPQIMQF